MKGYGPHTHLTSGRHLARNSIWNLLGQLLPLAVAIFAIPPIVRGLGVDRFGVLSLAWVVVGYFSLFDLGIGRALTKLVADKLGAREEHAVPSLAWTSLLLLLLLGMLGGGLTLALSSWLVHQALKVPAPLQAETLRSFYLLAFSIPLVTVTSGLRGILEALQRFRILNLIRIPMSSFSFLGALLVLPFSKSLVPVVAVLVLGRLAGALAHLVACFRALPDLRRRVAIQRSLVVPAISFGGWMTISSIISPIMIFADRFLVGVLLSVGVLAYYTAPFDMITRLTVIPGAVAGVLFPAFAMSLSTDPGRTELLLRRGEKYVVLAVFPILLIITTLAPEGLRLWLGPVFSQNGTAVLRWLAAGVFVNCMAQVPLALVQGAGRPDISAKLHLVELPLYLTAVWLLTTRLGIEGTAMAWAGRVTLDAVLLCFYAQRSLPRSSGFLAKAAATMGAGLLLLYLDTLPQSLAIRLGIAGLALLGFGLASWRWALALEERTFLMGNRVNRAAKPQSLTDVS